MDNYLNYVAIRKLSEYHLNGNSPYPRKTQEMFASLLISQYMRMEEDNPLFPEWYKNIGINNKTELTEI